MWEETSKFTQIEANNCALGTNVWGIVALVFLQESNFFFDELKVFGNIEVDKCSLPELFCVHSAPRVLILRYLLLPLFEWTKFLVVSIEEFKEPIKAVSDIFVNPGSVLELDDEVESVDHAQVVETLFVFF